MDQKPEASVCGRVVISVGSVISVRMVLVGDEGGIPAVEFEAWWVKIQKQVLLDGGENHRSR